MDLITFISVLTTCISCFLGGFWIGYRIGKNSVSETITRPNIYCIKKHPKYPEIFVQYDVVLKNKKAVTIICGYCNQKDICTIDNAKCINRV